jgi:hypothetical protein
MEDVGGQMCREQAEVRRQRSKGKIEDADKGRGEEWAPVQSEEQGKEQGREPSRESDQEPGQEWSR